MLSLVGKHIKLCFIICRLQRLFHLSTFVVFVPELCCFGCSSFHPRIIFYQSKSTSLALFFRKYLLLLAVHLLGCSLNLLHQSTKIISEVVFFFLHLFLFFFICSLCFLFFHTRDQTDAFSLARKVLVLLSYIPSTTCSSFYSSSSYSFCFSSFSLLPLPPVSSSSLPLFTCWEFNSGLCKC